MSIRNVFRSGQRKLINNSHRQGFSQAQSEAQERQVQVGIITQHRHQGPRFFPSFCLIILNILSSTSGLSLWGFQMAIVLSELLSTFQAGEMDVNEGTRDSVDKLCCFLWEWLPSAKNSYFQNSIPWLPQLEGR